MNTHPKSVPIYGLFLSNFISKIEPHKLIAVRWSRVIEMWIERSRQRRDLTMLDNRQLKDVGISRHEALCEIAKPFWR